MQDLRNDNYPDINLKSSSRIVCAATVGDITRTRLIRSYRGRTFHSPSCTIIDAILATLASPGNFPPITIQGIGAPEDFIDGDISCSNPVFELLQESVHVFGSHTKVYSIVSLGCGQETMDILAKEGTSSTAHTHISIACERTHEDMQRRTRNLNIYFRFNPGRNIHSSEAPEWKNLSTLKMQTMSYLQMEAISQQLDAAVSALHSDTEGISLSLISKSTLV